jgi:hypothetical protein
MVVSFDAPSRATRDENEIPARDEEAQAPHGRISANHSDAQYSSGFATRLASGP